MEQKYSVDLFLYSYLLSVYYNRQFLLDVLALIPHGKAPPANLVRSAGISLKNLPGPTLLFYVMITAAAYLLPISPLIRFSHPREGTASQPQAWDDSECDALEIPIPLLSELEDSPAIISTDGPAQPHSEPFPSRLAGWSDQPPSRFSLAEGWILLARPPGLAMVSA